MSEPLAGGRRSVAGCAGNRCGCPGLRPPPGRQQAGPTNNAANANHPPPGPTAFKAAGKKQWGRRETSWDKPSSGRERF